MARELGNMTVIGAGLNGPLLALGLVRRGFRVEIYERRPDMRRGRVSAGRSINLALSARGIHALQQAGLWKQMQKIIVPMRGRMMHSVTSELSFQPYGKDESEVINSISRADLNIALMNAAEAEGVTILFQQRCTGVDLKTGRLYLRGENSGTERSIDTEVVLGCDGSASVIRNTMLNLSRFDFSQKHLEYGYKELTIPAGRGQTHQLEKNALHIWPRGNYMLIALPNVDGTFGCILFLPFEGQNSFAQVDSPAAVRRFFESRFRDAASLMPDLENNFFANPTGTMVTIKCFPWHVGGKMLLLGDAAHAIVPFFGQGINCGFEDCTILLDLLDRNGGKWELIFRQFEQARKANTDAIADLAVENFVEMRDLVANPHFLFRKRVELALEERYPQTFVPKYAMVTFHRIPYATAKERGEIQDRILSEICTVDQFDDLDWRKADQLIHSKLSPLELA